MANRWLHTNKIKTVQKLLVADSTQAADYSANNLQTDNYAQTWRSADAASAHNIVNNFGSATQCDTCFLGNVNLTSAATVTIQANATDTWGAPSFTQNFTVSGLGNTPAHRNLYLELSSAQTFQFFRLLITNTTNPNGYYEVGEWWLGMRVTLGTGTDFETNHKQNFIRNNILQKTEWGQKYAYLRADYRIFSLEWAGIKVATRDNLRQLENATKGNQLPFVFVPDGTVTPSEAFFVRFASDLEINQITPIAYNASVTFEEEAAGVTLPA
mgnify:CR=1 FL=1